MSKEEEMMSKSEQMPPIMQMVQQMQQQQQQGHEEADVVPSDSDGGLVTEWFPTETVRPTESLDDGGIVIEGSIPTETIHLFEVLI